MFGMKVDCNQAQMLKKSYLKFIMINHLVLLNGTNLKIYVY